MWLELRENRKEERDEIRSYKNSSRTVGTHQALEQGLPSSVTGVAFPRMILWSTHPARTGPRSKTCFFPHSQVQYNHLQTPSTTIFTDEDTKPQQMKKL